MKLIIDTYQIKLSDIEISTIRIIPYNKGVIVYHQDGSIWNMNGREFDAYINESGYKKIKKDEV